MRIAILLVMLFVCAGRVEAAQVSGIVTDPSGAVVPGARVVLRDIASGVEAVTESDTNGRYALASSTDGTYLLIVSRDGFSAFSRTLELTGGSGAADIPVSLELGLMSMQLTITPARAERDQRQIPLHVETLGRESLLSANPLSTGDAIASALSVTPVGNGPFGVRPRLRGLDSTRLLILVDGERLNTARTATDRAGTEVGLVATDEIERVEVMSGAGSLMYGTDALAGTVNIITNEPTFSPSKRLLYGFNGFYSSNENGWRGSVSLGASAPRYAVRVQGGGRRLRRLRGGQAHHGGYLALLRVGATAAGGHDRRRVRVQLPRVSRSLQRAVRPDEQRRAQLRVARQLSHGVRPRQAERDAHGSRPLSAAACDGHRVSGFHRPLFLQRRALATE